MKSFLVARLSRWLGGVAAVSVVVGVGLIGVAAMPTAAQALSSTLVISQVYGAGGNSGATYNRDFIEIFNRGTTTVSLTGWSVQYASTTGTTWAVTTLSGSIPAGGYYLVGEASGANGIALPTVDASGSIAMAAGAGKVALLNTTTMIAGGTSCPSGPTVIDVVGYGTGTNCFEGTGPTGTINTANSAIRALAGCTETDNNPTDFAVAAVTPRNSGTTLNPCGGGFAAEPTVAASGPSFTAGSTTMTFNFTAGNGASRIVVVKQGSALTGTPSDGAAYAANAVFGSGGQIVAGEYVVLSGSGSSAAVSGLTPGTRYFFRVFEYNGSGGTENYLTSSFLAADQFTITAAPVAIAATAITSSGFTANWNATTGAVDYRLDVATDAGFTTFVSGFQDLTVAGTSQAVTGLVASTSYFYRVRAVNSGGTSDNSNTITVTTPGALASEPTVAASGLSFSSVSATSMDLNWTNGDGGSRIVVGRAGSAVGGTPSDGTSYTASAVFGSGGTIAANEFVVFNAAGTSVTVTGLIPSTTYHFAVFELNGSGGTENYLVTTPATGNQATTFETYTWNQTGSGSWATAANWTPTRTSPQSTDVLQFTAGGAVTVTSVPTQTVAQLLVSGSSTVNLEAGAASAVLTVGGGSGTDLSVGGSSALNIDGANPLKILVATGATGSISGSMMYSNAGHQLDAADASGITFQSGSTLTQGTGATAAIFTTGGTANAIVFASGSTLDQQATNASNPFQTGPKVVFQTGSLYRHSQTGGPSFSGRTYANFELNSSSATISGSGASALSIDNLTVTAGNLSLNMIGAFNLKGNVQVAPGASLAFSPLSPATITLNGSGAQTVGGSGTLTVSSNSTIDLNNAGGLSLARDVSIPGTLQLTSGNIVTNGNVLTVGTPTTTGSLVATGGHVVGNLQRTMVVGGGSASQTWPIGDATYATPVSLTGTSFPGHFQVTASTTPGDRSGLAASGIDPARSVNRYYTLSSSTYGGGAYDITLTFDPNDVDAAAASHTADFIIRKNTSGTWTATTNGTRTAITTQATGLTGFSDFSIGEQGIDHYLVSASSPQTQGATFSTSVAAEDALNLPVSTDNTTAVTMTSNGAAEFDSNGDTTFGDNVETLTNGGFSINTRDNTAETVTLTATDGNSKTGARTGLVIQAPLNITTTSLPNPTAGTAYSQTVAATGGATPYTWSIDSGSLPGGLVLEAGTGEIHGTATLAGTSNFVVKVTDTASGSDTQSLSIAVDAGPATQLVATQQPGSGLAGATITPHFIVRLRDAQGNNVTTSGVGVDVALTAGTGTLSGTTSRATDATGTAEFNDLSINAAGTGKQLTASSGSLTPAVSSFFDVFVDIEPTVAASGLGFSGVTPTSMELSWTNGDGASRIVVAKAASAVTGTPVDGTTYVADAAFGGGDLLDPDEYVVFNGSGSTVTVTGLSPTTTYHFAVFELNGSGGSENYLITTPATGSQATTLGDYTWSNPAGGNWVVPTNWTPTRTTPNATDIIRFNGFSGTVNNVPTETIGQLLVTNSPVVNLQAVGDGRVLTIGGGAGTDLSVDATSTLAINGNRTLTIRVGAGATGVIDRGAMSFSSVPNRLDAVDAGGVTFQNGGRCFQSAGCTGNVFTNTGTPDAIVFASSSTFLWAAGADPFALAQPASKVVFQPGSFFDQQQNAVPSFSGRTYGDYQLKFPGSNISVTGTSPVSMGKIRIGGGRLNINLTTPVHIRGDIQVDASQTLTFNPATPAIVHLDGSSVQTISGAGTLSIGQNSPVEVNNTAGISLSRNVTIQKSLTLTNGNVVTNSNVLTMVSGHGVVPTGGHVVGNLEMTMVVIGGSADETWPIGDGTHYTPVSLAGSNFPGTFQVTVSTTSEDDADLAASGIDPARSANRYYTLSSVSYPGGEYDISLTFDPADLDVGATPSRFVIRKNTSGAWTAPAMGTLTATTAQATGLTGFSDFSIGEQAIDHYVVSASSPQNQGATFSTSVAAEDVLNVPVTTDNTTAVTMTSNGSAEFDSNGDATFGDNVKTLTNGAFNIATRDNTAETVTLTATDGNSKTGSVAGIVIQGVLTITTTSLPNATAGTPYSQTVAATGGSTPYDWSIDSGSLPAGLVLDNTTGEFHGTATLAGTSNFVVKVTDATSGTDTQALSITVVAGAPASLTFDVQPSGALVNAAITPAVKVKVTDGSGNPIATELVSLSLVGTGTLSGNPPTNTDANGIATFSALSVDFSGNGKKLSASAGSLGPVLSDPFNITCPTITLNPTTLPDGTVGTTYGQSVSASGGLPPYSFVVTSGSLPGGLALDPTNGAFAGAPTGNGTFNFTITATDAAGCTGSQAYTVVVSTSCPAISVLPTSLPAGSLTVAYNQTLTASAGTAPFVFAVTVGSLPTGLSLSAGGALIGTPTAVGTFPFTVGVTDANSCTGSRGYSITILGIPSPVSNLASAQVLTGNDADGSTKITLTWTMPSGAASSEVYRAGFGHYPEYDDAGGVVPTTPSYPPGAPWALTGVTTSGQTDEPAARDFYYYVVFVKNAAGGVSAVSNKTLGSLNYHLGDVSDGFTLGQGNNSVGDEDVSLLGGHYGITGSDIITQNVAYLDVGPTTNLQLTSRPFTDDRIDFEDLILFATNYHMVSKAVAVAGGGQPPTASGPEEFQVSAPSLVEAGSTVTAVLRLKAGGRIQGFSAQLGWDATVVTPEGMTSSQWVEGQGGIVLTPGQGTVDAALLGVRGVGLTGEGEVARVRFRVLRTGNAGFRLAKVEARNAANHALGEGDLTQRVEAERPTRTVLLAPWPNPFQGSAGLEFSLAEAGAVELAVYGVDGRRVRTLVREQREAGVYREAWDGRDDGRHAVGSGVFYVNLVTGGRRYTKTIVYLR